MLPSTLFLLSLCITLAASQCTDNSTDTAGLQELITNGGEGYVLSLCAGQVYAIEQPLNFTSSGQVSLCTLCSLELQLISVCSAEQEISTESYPTDSSRATLFINGSREDTAERVAHIIAIQGICNNCSDVRVWNIQVSGYAGEVVVGAELPDETRLTATEETTRLQLEGERTCTSVGRTRARWWSM